MIENNSLISPRAMDEDENKYQKPKNHMVAVTYQTQESNISTDESSEGHQDKIYWTAFGISRSTTFKEL